jgi:hypothetical protein
MKKPAVRRRILRPLAVFALLAVIIGFAWSVYGPSDLLNRAALAAAVGISVEGQGETYAWVDDHTIVMLRRRTGRAGVSLEAARLDTKTRAESSLPAVASWLNSRPQTAGDHWSVSPSGDGILWHGEVPRAGLKFQVVSTDGTRRDEWTPALTFVDPPLALWLRDGRQVLVLTGAARGSKVSLALHTVGSKPTLVSSGDFTPNYYRHIGVARSGHGIGITPRVGDHAVTLVEYQLPPKPANRIIRSVPVPAEAHGRCEVALSLKEDRLA